MTVCGLIFRHLTFTGSHVKPAGLDFQPGLNLIYGASNTGKSFTLKSLDFMLGGTKQLPDVKERKGYEKIWLGFSLKGEGDFTLSRAIDGGSYVLYRGLIKSDQPGQRVKTLSQKHNAKSDDNLSKFLLDYLGLAGKVVAKNAAGVKHSLSFRDLAEILLVDETNIQIEQSPIESGQFIHRPKEHSVFRLLITGTDDSAIEPIIDKKTFNTSKAVRLKMIEEMISEAESKLAKSYPDVDDLPAQNERLEITLQQNQSEFEVAQGSILKLIEKKRNLSIQIPQISERLEDIQVHIERFSQLDKIYLSDIERLDSLEEAGFILSLQSDLDCSLCGAPAEAQKFTQPLEKIEQIRSASLVEMEKIKHQQADLAGTVHNLECDREKLKTNLPELIESLSQVENEIAVLVPETNKNQCTLNEIIKARDYVIQGLALLDQREELFSKRDDLIKLKKPNDSLKLHVPRNEVYEFCKVISKVLKQWEFPGECNVSFDEKKYDLIIDGKLRTDNGKGVRAVTHAAFKVALLLFCHDKGLPHPGFIVLDTPLLTYRDPMKNPKLGELSEDEKELAKTSLKQRFFEHLDSIRDLGQFIILENIDPPVDVENLAHVHLFYGMAGGGRNGLFPLSTNS
ncbi:MAG: hypothetical protein KAJ40_07035 [Alphaproteobacteria bacterium]|nr:hypothetical protein [Alphaproteobacteria bacterium]